MEKHYLFNRKIYNNSSLEFILIFAYYYNYFSILLHESSQKTTVHFYLRFFTTYMLVLAISHC